jgi:hypothetical protein
MKVTMPIIVASVTTMATVAVDVEGTVRGATTVESRGLWVSGVMLCDTPPLYTIYINDE